METDVLVIGGGPAGTWAAVSAARSGARVILADKGFCGTSGATAPSGTAVWYVPPDVAARGKAKATREELGGFLAHHDWMDAVLETTFALVNELGERGYPFPRDVEGRLRQNSLQGPEYMRLMRKLVKGAGARILDHSPALELLVDEEGAVAGARGIDRRTHAAWQVKAKSVVIATGGCAFLSRALGTNNLTGDGYLMAAEAGAELSGMEFSNAYAIAPVFSSVTKTLFYEWASFTDASGAAIAGAASKGGRSVIARALQRGAVFAQLDRADGEIRTAMRVAQPNFFLPFDRAGIDPFTQPFEITLRLEGTVRGTGGLRLVDRSAATTVPGLYAAGDAATRELICGGFTGGGSHNAAWAMSSGAWAGEGAAGFARQRRADLARTAAPVGSPALVSGRGRAFDPAALIEAVQAEVFPFDTNYFRSGDGLARSLTRLDSLWRSVRTANGARPEDVLKAREAVAMLATARWMYRSGLARTESRGMHRRYDLAALDPAQRHHVTSGGFDEVWTGSVPASGQPLEAAA